MIHVRLCCDETPDEQLCLQHSVTWPDKKAVSEKCSSDTAVNSHAKCLATA